MSLNYIQYFFESAWALSLFLAGYFLLVKKNTTPLFRKHYLALTSALGIFIPLLLNIGPDLNGISGSALPQFAGSIREWTQTRLEEWAPGISISVFDFWLLVHFMGFSVHAFRVMDRFWPYREIISRKNYQSGPPLHHASSRLAALFWFPKGQGLETHPRHFRFRHSLELIWVEGLVAAHWFNPLIYWYKEEWKNCSLHLAGGTVGDPLKSWSAWPKWATLALLIWLPFLLNPLSGLRLQTSDWLTVLKKPVFQVAKKAEPTWEFTNPDHYPSKLEEQADTTYLLKWGDITIPLWKYANPNVYGGYLDVEVDAFLPNLGEPVRIYEKGEKMPIKELEVSNYRRRRGESNTWKFRLRNEMAQITSSGDQVEISDQLLAGDRLFLTGEAGDIRIHSLQLKFKTDLDAFEPQVSVMPLDLESPLFGFQVLTRKGFKTRLKVDTMEESTKKILPLYQDTSRFEIIHIPGFQTRNRLLNYSDLSPILEVAKGPKGEDWLYMDHLQEYHPAPDANVHLQWGPMFAKPDSEVYPMDDFQAARAQGLELWISDTLFSIEKALLIVYPKDGEAYVKMHEPGKNTLRELLNGIRPKTSIKVAGILIRNPENEIRYFAPEFVFHVGSPKSEQNWTVEVQATAEGESGKPQKRVDEERIEFRRYPLTELIAELLGQRLNRLEFRNLESVPFVDLRFSAGSISQDLAYQLMLDELQKKYRFTVHRERLERKHWRMQVSEEQKLEQAYYESDGKPIEKVRALEVDGYHLFTGVNLYELCEYLEDRFDRIFELYPSQYVNDSFIFGLDLDSFEEVKEQLEGEYGLQLIEGNWLWNGYIVRF